VLDENVEDFSGDYFRRLNVKVFDEICQRWRCIRGTSATSRSTNLIFDFGAVALSKSILSLGSVL